MTDASLEADGPALAITRHFKSPIENVWASIAESDRLARWFGTWTGDPSTGFVMVTMNAEAEAVEAVRYEIRECDPPRVLAVSAIDDVGAWHLRAVLSESQGITELVFRHEQVDPDHVAAIRVGWEWYLDRLSAVLLGDTPPTLEEFETKYLPRAAN